MKLYALSDLHLAHAPNRQALIELPQFPEDWLILAGDVGESARHLRFAFETLGSKFKQLLWTPGNHELWTVGRGNEAARGEAKYHELVDLCRAYGVLTPEEPYPIWEGDGPRCVVAPLFLLYDYSFRPDDVSQEQVIAWSREQGIACADELLLHPDPYPSRSHWCRNRCRLTRSRLEELDPGLHTVLVNHFSFRYDLVRLRRIPRFSPWCGTTQTEDWHLRFRALACVSGHLHIRSTQWRDGVRFEEVSLGYPRDWDQNRGIAPYLREILPGDSSAAGYGF